METFKEFVNKPYEFRYKGKYIADVNHADDRKKERLRLSQQELFRFYRNIIDKFLELGVGYTSQDGKYLFYSKILKQAVIVDYTVVHKLKAITKDRQFLIITYFPHGDNYARKDTEKIIVERHNKAYQISEEVSEYIQNILDENVIIKNGFEEINCNLVDICNEKYPCTIEIYENKVWCLHEFEIIEVK